jgi:hypothetical protein
MLILPNVAEDSYLIQTIFSDQILERKDYGQNIRNKKICDVRALCEDVEGI